MSRRGADRFGADALSPSPGDLDCPLPLFGRQPWRGNDRGARRVRGKNSRGGGCDRDRQYLETPAEYRGRDFDRSSADDAGPDGAERSGKDDLATRTGGAGPAETRTRTL